ncbi:MAG: ABC transporter ATP-binding protein [Eubacteriales bacterium]|nr:ABC transporter ATP-binding protein [Eubacteriales bacterium]
MSSRFRKFLSYYKPYSGLLVADLACALVVAAVSVVLPLLVQHIAKDIVASGLPDALTRVYWVGLAMVALILVHMFAEMFVDYQGHGMGAMIERDLRRELYDHYLSLSFGFYDEQRVGQLMSRLTHDLLSLAELYHHGPEDLALAVLKFAGALVVLLKIHVKLTLVVLAFMPAMALLSILFNRKMNAALRQSREAVGDINAKVEDTLSGIRVVKAFANEELERNRFAALNQRFLESRKLGYRSEATYYSPFTAVTQLVSAAVVVVGGAGILKAQMDVEDLLTFTLLVTNFIEPIRGITNFARLYQEGFTGFDRFMEMMRVAPDIADAPGARSLGRVRGEITFDRVSFGYQSREGSVISDLRLHIAAGEYVALVGPSGAGKSTLFSLIPRFYDVTQGAVLLDGQDIRGIKLRELRRSIGIVQQDTYLYAGTVLENIGFGKPGASRDDIVRAARLANAHDFITALPQGYDTDVGQRGVKLSGGQRQRLSIARVFLQDPPVILFDEATSALDNESEKAVQESLERLARGRTTLVIAHRLSTIRKAQRVLVLTERGIAEQGTHRQLLAQGGEYARLYRMQFET